MDSGLTLDQVIQKIEERKRWIANADISIQGHKVNWAEFKRQMDLRSVLAKAFLMEIESYAHSLASEKDDFSTFFNDINLGKLDDLRADFQKIAALSNEISKCKDEYDKAELQCKAVEELRRQWNAQAEELRLKYLPVNTYDTDLKNLYDGYPMNIF